MNTTHTNAGSYSDTWSFSGGSNYNDIAATTITDIITAARPADHFAVTVTSSSVLAGISFSITVTALDSYGRVVTGYTGRVRVSSTDSAIQAIDIVFGSAELGVKTATSFVLKTPGSQTVTARDTAFTDLFGSVAVNVAADVTNQVSVSRSGLTYNRTTQLQYGSMTIKNIGSTSIAGGLRVVLQGLTPGVTLSCATITIGTMTYNLSITYTSAGNPIVTIGRSLLSALTVGQSIRIDVQFKNPGMVLFDYVTKVFSDPLA